MSRFLSVPLLLTCCAGPLAVQGPAPPDLPLSESGRDAATYRLYGSDPAAAALYASFHTAVEPPHKAEPAPAPVPPAPGLTVDGKYTLTVTEMPFRVLAPAGADLYFWRVPFAWTAADDGATLTVTAAPAGAATVGLQTVTFDLVGKKTLKGSYSLSVAVGQAPGPLPPSDGALGLIKVSRDGASGVAVRAAEAPKLAAAARSVVAMIGAGAFAGSAADPAALAAAVLQARRAANQNAGVTVTAWAGWAAAVDGALQGLYAAGRLKTAQDWAEALTEIATGLSGG